MLLQHYGHHIHKTSSHTLTVTYIHRRYSGPGAVAGLRGVCHGLHAAGQGAGRGVSQGELGVSDVRGVSEGSE